MYSSSHICDYFFGYDKENTFDKTKEGYVRSMKRYRFVDHIRGLALLSMIAYHAVWDLVNMYGWRIEWYISEAGEIWQQSICWTFILLSGFCWSFGQKKVKRGLIVFSGGLLITVITLLVMPQNRVIFGVLTMLGTCMLLQSWLEPIWKRWNSIVGLLMAFLIFILLKNINQGYIGMGEVVRIPLPKALYANLFTTFLGFQAENFFSTDYFSLIPWYFLFLTGYFAYRFLAEKELLGKIPNIHIAPLEWVGKHSLMIYMLHQPVVYGVLLLIYSLGQYS